MPDLARLPAADAAELLHHLLDHGDLAPLPDGTAVLTLIVEPALLDRISAWGVDEREDDHDREQDDADREEDDPAEDDDPIGEDAELDEDHRYQPQLAADGKTWVLPSVYGRPGQHRTRRARPLTEKQPSTLSQSSDVHSIANDVRIPLRVVR